jgi:hypothetical protein
MPVFVIITLDILPSFYEMFFLHIANFQLIEALNWLRLHCWTIKYAQICTNFSLVEATYSNKFQNLKKNVGRHTINLTLNLMYTIAGYIFKNVLGFLVKYPPLFWWLVCVWSHIYENCRSASMRWMGIYS